MSPFMGLEQNDHRGREPGEQRMKTPPGTVLRPCGESGGSQHPQSHLLRNPGDTSTCNERAKGFISTPSIWPHSHSTAGSGDGKSLSLTHFATCSTHTQSWRFGVKMRIWVWKGTFNLSVHSHFSYGFIFLLICMKRISSVVVQSASLSARVRILAPPLPGQKTVGRLSNSPGLSVPFCKSDNTHRAVGRHKEHHDVLRTCQITAERNDQ